jgi:hypothetical protein
MFSWEAEFFRGMIDRLYNYLKTCKLSAGRSLFPRNGIQHVLILTVIKVSRMFYTAIWIQTLNVIIINVLK